MAQRSTCRTAGLNAAKSIAEIDKTDVVFVGSSGLDLDARLVEHSACCRG